MSMIGNLLRVSQNELDEYLNESSLLEDRIYNNESVNDDHKIDIDKSWEGIFYLLTGFGVAEVEKAQPPLSWTLFNDQVIDANQDMGYGPASYSTPDQVRMIHHALLPITEDILRQKFDATIMMELGIYPEIWSEGEEALSYLIEYFKSLKEFYAIAADKNQSVITFLN